jgi:hypothetical protein
MAQGSKKLIVCVGCVLSANLSVFTLSLCGKKERTMSRKVSRQKRLSKHSNLHILTAKACRGKYTQRYAEFFGSSNALKIIVLVFSVVIK